MTSAAWATLGVTWAVIGFFTARFFLMVLRRPGPSGDEACSSDGGGVAGASEPRARDPLPRG